MGIRSNASQRLPDGLASEQYAHEPEQPAPTLADARSPRHRRFLRSGGQNVPLSAAPSYAYPQTPHLSHVLHSLPRELLPRRHAVLRHRGVPAPASAKQSFTATPAVAQNPNAQRQSARQAFTRLLPPERDSSEIFGLHPRVHGDWLAAGSVRLSDSLAGVLHVYHRARGQWQHHQRLAAPDAQPGDDFGFASDLDGTTLVVGAPGFSSNAHTRSDWLPGQATEATKHTANPIAA